jgi:rhodanese-related sulfurtransferase
VDWKRTGKEAAAILAVALVPAVLFNLSLIRRQLKGEFDRGLFVPAGTAGIAFIGLIEAGDLFQGGAAFFVDSRPREKYGEGHVPGALSLPLKDAEERAVAVDPGSLNVPPARPLVVYCDGGDCRTSVLLALRLKEAGFKDIRVFEGGWAEWSGAGFPVEVGVDPE